MTTARQALAAAGARLSAAGVEGAPRDAEVLLQHALDCDRSWVIAHRDDALEGAALARFEAAVARRIRREPVSRIIGRREFWSLDFIITPDVLDPRPDTETVVEAVLRHAPAPTSILDLGTGSGCILLSLLSERRGARGVGVDRSEAAARVAAGNARLLNLADRATFVVSDWGASLAGQFDVVVSNPPYIPRAEVEKLAPEVRNYEPHGALIGGADGLDCYRRVLIESRRLVTTQGLIALELGAGQADSVAAIAMTSGLSEVTRVRDLGDHERCLLLRKAA